MLNSSAVMSLKLGIEYVEEGASPSDIVDGSVSVISNGSLEHYIGVYTINCTATDARETDSKRYVKLSEI